MPITQSGVRIDYSELHHSEDFLKSGYINLLVASKSKFRYKSIVVCIRGENLSPFLNANPSWQMSQVLGAAFRYLKPSPDGGLIQLNFSALSEGDVISIEPWGTSGPGLIDQIFDGVFQQGTLNGLRVAERIA